MNFQSCVSFNPLKYQKMSGFTLLKHYEMRSFLPLPNTFKRTAEPPPYGEWIMPLNVKWIANNQYRCILMLLIPSPDDEMVVFCKLWLWHPGKTAYQVHLSGMMKVNHILEFPNEILTTVLIMVASSYDGASDIARLGSTCVKLMNLAGEPDVLKVVNFRRLTPTNDYKPHHNINGLLCQCAEAGNLAAEAMLGRALLFNDYWYWNAMVENEHPYIGLDGPGSGVLWHEKLVRSFIANSSCDEMASMRIPLFSYMISFLGHDVARECGILVAVTNLCSYEIIRLNVRRLSTIIPESSRSNRSVSGLSDAMARLRPPSGATHRERLLELFDQMFPNVVAM